MKWIPEQNNEKRMSRSEQTCTPTLAELNELQSNGLISDLCVTWADVPECDRGPALKWLRWQETREE